MRRFNLTLTFWPDFAQRQDTGQDASSQIWMQWMTITSLNPCYDSHVSQYVAVSLFGPLNQIRPICRNCLCISGLGISRHRFQFGVSSPMWIDG